MSLLDDPLFEGGGAMMRKLMTLALIVVATQSAGSQRCFGTCTILGLCAALRSDFNATRILYCGEDA